jgi:hypothetical protein
MGIVTALVTESAILGCFGWLLSFVPDKVSHQAQLQPTPPFPSLPVVAVPSKFKPHHNIQQNPPRIQQRSTYTDENAHIQPQRNTEER